MGGVPVGDVDEVQGHHFPHKGGISGDYHSLQLQPYVCGVHLHAVDRLSDGQHSIASKTSTASPSSSEFSFEDMFSYPNVSNESDFDSRLISNAGDIALIASQPHSNLTANSLVDVNLQKSTQSSPWASHEVQETSSSSQHPEGIQTLSGRNSLSPQSPPIPIPESKTSPVRRRQRNFSSPLCPPPLPLPYICTRRLNGKPVGVPPLRIPPSNMLRPLAMKSFFDFGSTLDESSSYGEENSHDINMEAVKASSGALPCCFHSARFANSSPPRRQV